jgi:hypothetical protein
MKKITAAILASIMVMTLFTACGKTAEVPASTATPEPSPSATQTPIVNPLTGEAVDSDISSVRPYAIMINNISVAQPQVGVSNADIIYEVLAEGGITRMMAIFDSVNGIDKIGSMRSLRPYYLSISMSYDAITVHAGGSEQAYSDVKSYGADDIDGVRGSYANGTFFRDKSRQQYGIEHSLFATGSGIIATTQQKGFRTTHNDGYNTSYNLTFSETAADQCADPAGYVKVAYNTSKNTSFTYDSASGLYTAYQYGDTYTDNGKTPMTFKNVLVLFADTKTVDSYGRLSVNLIGSGDGYFCCGGKYTAIKWQRSDAGSSFSYTLADGSPLSFGVGKSFISVVPTGSTFGSKVTFQASK